MFASCQLFRVLLFCVAEDRLRDSRSHSPALTDIQARLALSSAASHDAMAARPASAAHISYAAHHERPASQLSAHTLHAYGSGRARASKRPVPVVYPGPAHYSALQTLSCRQMQDQVGVADVWHTPNRGITLI